jgi:hypothetical protein
MLRLSPSFWGGGRADCAAIILIGNASPQGFARAFLDLVRGFDLPIGNVVIITSASHLGRGGGRLHIPGA